MHELVVDAGAGWMQCSSCWVWCLGLRGSNGIQGGRSADQRYWSGSQEGAQCTGWSGNWVDWYSSQFDWSDSLEDLSGNLEDLSGNLEDWTGSLED